MKKIELLRVSIVIISLMLSDELYTAETPTLSYALAKASRDCPTYSYRSPDGQLFVYNNQFSNQLRNICSDMNHREFKIKRPEILALIKKGANPNIGGMGIHSLLSISALFDDLELAQCCLQNGANPNPEQGDQPATEAKSVAVLQSLADYNANLNYKNHSGNLLHHAVMQYRSVEVMTFLCNAGLNPNNTDQFTCTPLHDLMSKSHRTSFLEKAALFLWYDADPNKKNGNNKTHIEILQAESPTLVPQVQALGAAVPLVKDKQKKEYCNILATHIANGPASLVMTYGEPAWGNTCWPQISPLIPQSADATHISKSAKTHIKK